MRWIVLTAALLLGGCNLVMSDHPMFNGVAQTHLRPGLWRIEHQHDDCGEHRTPARSNDECPGYVLVTPEGIRSSNRGELGPPTPVPIYDGDPPIIEAHSDAPQGQGAAYYYFLGVDPLQRGDDGQLTAFSAWMVECGPPPSAPTGLSAADVTEHPWPGLTMHGSDCTADSADAIRAAARQSRSLDRSLATLRWIGPAR